ncbi:hypothetical protein DH2020_017162 [Rehmannia glutinosa]|uniref:HMA domain-containing protein n=1 Tax=Rehmannia glutinosa TaxID=99300 RepID=A0ABR0WTF8_REHGL
MKQVTVMVLKVDLQCPCCYKKVKKILCKFPQIRNQVYDEKSNTVTITVVCCSPEKIRDKLCRKGAKVIKSIEIKEPPSPKSREQERAREAQRTRKAQRAEKPKIVVIEKPKEPEKPKVVVVEKPKEPEKPKVVEKPKEAPKPDPPKKPEPAPNPPPPEPVMVPVNGFPPAFPGRTCCGPCYEGYGGGPCYHGYGVPPPPQPCYDGYYEYGYGYGHGNRGCQVSRCDYYFSEENPQGCSIM